MTKASEVGRVTRTKVKVGDLDLVEIGRKTGEQASAAAAAVAYAPSMEAESLVKTPPREVR